MSLIASLLVLMAAANLLGRCAERVGQPALLGHMLAGILLGPSLLAWLAPGPGLSALVDFSVMFVVIAAGLEMRMQDLLATLRGRGAIALTLGFVVPALSAAAVARAFGLPFVEGAVVVLCISVTALPVALRILGEFGLLETRVARVAIASSLMTDLVVLMALGTLIAIAGRRDAGSAAFATGAIAVAKLFVLLAAVGTCHFVCLRLAARRAAGKRLPFAAWLGEPVVPVLLFVLGGGALSEALGFHFAIGVFLASLLVTPDVLGETRFREISRSIGMMAAAVFGPVFLAYQGVQFDLGALNNVPLVFGLVLVAALSKLVGGYAAGRLTRLPHYEACGVAIVMNARGVMEMVVASIAYRAELVTQELFSALLMVGIATTVITPVMLRYWLKDQVRMKAMLSAGKAGAGASAELGVR